MHTIKLTDSERQIILDARVADAKRKRAELLNGLSRCSKHQRHLFKRAYSPDDPDKPIADVVRALSSGRLTWALQQVARTHELNAEQTARDAKPPPHFA